MTRHATLACYKTMQNTNLKVRTTTPGEIESHQNGKRLFVHGNALGKSESNTFKVYYDIGLGRETKIALRCSDEKELLALQAQAQSLKLYTRSIQDA